MVAIKAGDDLPQPHPLRRDGPMHSPAQLVLHFLELGDRAIAAGFPLEEEVPRRDLPHQSMKPRTLKVSGSSLPVLFAIDRRMAAKRDQAGLVRMHRQRELLKPRAHSIEEAASVVLMRETSHQIIGIERFPSLAPFPCR
ncbi:MAG: hypothetical protein ACR2KT_04705 [Methylocella sp.]